MALHNTGNENKELTKPQAGSGMNQGSGDIPINPNAMNFDASLVMVDVNYSQWLLT